MNSLTDKSAATPQKYRLGYRREDAFVRLSPFDPMLTEVGRLRYQGNDYAILRHDRSGALCARNIHAVGPHLIRAFRV